MTAPHLTSGMQSGTTGSLLRSVYRAIFTSGRDPVEMSHSRLIVGAALFALAFGAVGVRLIDVAVLQNNEPKQVRAVKPAEVNRAEIVDRNGILLATSIGAASVYADPRKIPNIDEAASKLAEVLPGVDAAQLKQRMSGDRSFVYIKRDVTPRQQYDVNRLGIPGIGFEREDKRLYPHGRLLSHIIGFSDIDNNGLAGVEKGLNDRLRSGGDPVALSVDLRIQHVVHQELSNAITHFNAIGGAGLIMDVYTGELLALVSLPDFDPAKPGESPDDARFNRATLGIYEMGSTFKIFNTAMGLETGVTSMTGGYDASAPIQISRFRIKDDHPKNRWLSTPEIFMYSSNIGSAKMAMAVGAAGQRAFMDRLGLLTAPRFEIPEVGHPQVPMPWRPINVMTVAFGHGISVSAVQLVRATAAVVNGGVLVQPTVVKKYDGETIAGTRVMSPQTSENMRRLMRLVVTNGTAKRADVPGYVVGGKTGTAEKIGPRGGYLKNANVTSFVSAFPLHNPRYVVMVMLDEPKGLKETYGFATAGWNSAPTTGKIIARIGPILGIEPTDETRPEIAQALAVNIAGGGPRAPSQ